MVHAVAAVLYSPHNKSHIDEQLEEGRKLGTMIMIDSVT